MKQFKQKDIVVSTQTQKTNYYYAEIDINYISQNICTDLDWIYFEETLPGKGSYPSKNFRHATLEEIKAYEEKGPHVLEKEKEENYIGRWLKCLINNAQCIDGIKQGDYVHIIDETSYNFKIAFNQRSDYGASKNKLGTAWELMPKGFDPLKQDLNPPLEKETYKPDDWVVMLEDYAALKKGSVLQILKKQTEGGICWILKHKEKGSYLAPYERMFRKALPDEIPKIENMEPKSMFDIGDIIDTDDTGYQCTEMGKLSKDSLYTWRIIRKCNVKTITKLNTKILDKAYSPYTSSWWYKVGYYSSNWISENCISLHNKDKCVKLPEKPEERKYSVGDYVVCIGDVNKSKCGHESAGWEKNLCFVVKRVDKYSKGLNILWEGRKNRGVYEDQVRMATKEEEDECRIHGDMCIIKDKQDLIKEAEKRYPIGTKFISFRDQGRVREVKPYIGHTTVIWGYLNGDVRSDNGLYTKDVNGKACCSNPTVYENGVWATIVKDDVESELDKWLKETKAKNMTLSQLEDYINSSKTCPFTTIYSVLEGEGNEDKAEILFNKWYPEKVYSREENYIIGIDPYRQEEPLSIKHQAPIIFIKKKNTSKLIIINK